MTLILVKSKDSDHRIKEVRLKSDLGDLMGNDGSCSFDLSQECIALVYKSYHSLKIPAKIERPLHLSAITQSMLSVS